MNLMSLQRLMKTKFSQLPLTKSNWSRNPRKSQSRNPWCLLSSLAVL